MPKGHWEGPGSFNLIGSIVLVTRLLTRTLCLGIDRPLGLRDIAIFTMIRAGAIRLGICKPNEYLIMNYSYRHSIPMLSGSFHL